eukprot:m.1012678 g.1012678  ORF g.1012678 m.1012678 type:complete len:85 (+) comp24067_c0_seq15:4233-4487(+)
MGMFTKTTTPALVFLCIVSATWLALVICPVQHSIGASVVPVYYCTVSLVRVGGVGIGCNVHNSNPFYTWGALLGYMSLKEDDLA